MDIRMGTFDFVALAIVVILALVYTVTVLRDLKEYAERDPMPTPEDK